MKIRILENLFHYYLIAPKYVKAHLISLVVVTDECLSP